MALKRKRTPRTPKPKPDQSELEEELAQARRWAVYVFIAINAFLFLIDGLGRLLKDTTFHVETFVFLIAAAALLTLLGLQGFERIFGKKSGEE